MPKISGDEITVKWKDDRIEYTRQYNKIYRDRFEEIERERKRKWALLNRESQNQRNRLWRKSNPNIKIARYNEYKAGAIRRNITFDITYDDFIKHWGVNCFYCDSVINGIGIDRTMNSLGYIETNVVPCCRRCNVMKSNLDSRDFIRHINNISKNNRLLPHSAEVDGG